MNTLTLADIRKMAVEVHCYNMAVTPARMSFVRRMNQLISRAAKIRNWA